MTVKRPSFQFYPDKWMSDLKLRRCSPAARGVWVDIMCAFHDSDDGYGMLRWPLRDIANTVGASIANARELVDKGVLRGSDAGILEPFIYTPRSGRRDGEPVTLIAVSDGPCWYSKRMVKDEYVRTIRGESTRFGEDDGEAPKGARTFTPKTPLSDGTSSSSSSSPTVENTPNPRKRGLSSPMATDVTPTIPCPYAQIVGLYHELLPGLPKAKLMPTGRQKALRKVWGWVLSSTKSDGRRRAETADEALAWLRGYFERAGGNDWLMGRTSRDAEHANWRCDLDFLLTDRGMKHVIEKTQDAAA